ncbi:hypothetical protein GCM10010975_37310 [Comamonas phosphati]|nr:hypothetical protein GCM10010975_37310 [Comamonas phosphati]
MVMGLARKVGETKPPSVTMAQTTTNSTKKPVPSSHFIAGLTGSSGTMRRLRARGAGLEGDITFVMVGGAE